jgi:hypothetical protein
VVGGGANSGPRLATWCERWSESPQRTGWKRQKQGWQRAGSPIPLVVFCPFYVHVRAPRYHRKWVFVVHDDFTGFDWAASEYCDLFRGVACIPLVDDIEPSSQPPHKARAFCVKTAESEQGVARRQRNLGGGHVPLNRAPPRSFLVESTCCWQHVWCVCFSYRYYFYPIAPTLSNDLSLSHFLAAPARRSHSEI